MHAERLEHWLERGRTRGSDERRAIIEPMVEPVTTKPRALDPADARRAAASALWLLELGHEGIALTHTGALNRALVREGGGSLARLVER